jgi:hypothetical protein
LPACLSFDLKLKPSPSTRHGFRRVLDLASPCARRACHSAAPGIKLHQLLLSEGVMREPQVCKHQVCVLRGDDEKPSQWRTSSEMAAKNPEDSHPSH